MLRARLLLSRVLVSCSCVKISLFMGRPASSFLGEGKARVIEEEKGEERERQEGFQGCRVLLLLHAGSADPVDVNTDGATSQPCPSLVPCAGVVRRAWRSTPSWRTSW